MGLVLTKTEDPRDKLAKATRDELWGYAKTAGVLSEMLTQLTSVGWAYDRGWQQRHPGFVATQGNVTKEDMENYLRGRGFINPQVAIRVMGAPVGYLDDGKEPDRKPSPAPAATDYDAMAMNELRAACRERGIKMARTDNLGSLREKLKAA